MTSAMRDEVRIKHNLERLLEAKSSYDHLSRRAQNARSQMVSIVADLRAAGGIEEANRIVGEHFQ